MAAFEDLTLSRREPTPDPLAALFAGVPCRHLASGEALFRQGEPAHHIFRIETGRVQMLRYTAAGTCVAIHTGRPGELFAEGALFAEVYGCDALAKGGAAVVRAAPKAVMLEQMREDPSLLLSLSARLARQLHDARTLLELRGIRSARERVYTHLRLLADETGAVRLGAPFVEIAGDLGLSHEAYYRALAALARDGAIERQGRAVRLETQGPA